MSSTVATSISTKRSTAFPPLASRRSEQRLALLHGERPDLAPDGFQSVTCLDPLRVRRAVMTSSTSALCRTSVMFHISRERRNDVVDEAACPRHRAARRSRPRDDRARMDADGRWTAGLVRAGGHAASAHVGPFGVMSVRKRASQLNV
jgi:hypothetical protein